MKTGWGAKEGSNAVKVKLDYRITNVRWELIRLCLNRDRKNTEIPIFIHFQELKIESRLKAPRRSSLDLLLDKIYVAVAVIDWKFFQKYHHHQLCAIQGLAKWFLWPKIEGEDLNIFNPLMVPHIIHTSRATIDFLHVRKLCSSSSRRCSLRSCESIPPLVFFVRCQFSANNPLKNLSF